MWGFKTFSEMWFCWWWKEKRSGCERERGYICLLVLSWCVVSSMNHVRLRQEDQALARVSSLRSCKQRLCHRETSFLNNPPLSFAVLGPKERKKEIPTGNELFVWKSTTCSRNRNSHKTEERGRKGDEMVWEAREVD